MKVALISCHSFLTPGGVKRHVLGLQKEFKRRGIEAKIIIPRRKLKEYYGKDIILLGTSFPINFGGSKSDLDINFNHLAIEETLRKEKFDILHFHNFSFPSVIQFLISPYVSSTLNITTFHSNAQGSNFLKKFPIIISALNKILKWKVDGLIGVSKLCFKVFGDYKGPKIVIPNGIDLEEFNPKIPKIKKYLDGKTNLLFVGRLHKRKGLIYLLRAFKILQKKFSNIRLIIVGDGELKEKCLQYVKNNRLKDVCFEGSISGKKVASYYNTCDIFCSPAIFGESFGIVLLEAMACRKPVVAFASEGYRELLKDKKGAFLARNRDYRDLAKKLETLLKSRKTRERMGKEALKEVREYSWPKVADQILNFYKFCRKNKKRKTDFQLPFINGILDKIKNFKFY